MRLGILVTVPERERLAEIDQAVGGEALVAGSDRLVHGVFGHARRVVEASVRRGHAGEFEGRAQPLHRQPLRGGDVSHTLERRARRREIPGPVERDAAVEQRLRLTFGVGIELVEPRRFVECREGARVFARLAGEHAEPEVRRRVLRVERQRALVVCARLAEAPRRL